MGIEYDEPEEGEWVQPVKEGYKFCCCDCGLVHNLDFRIRHGKVQFRAYRNERSTGQIRRYKREKENNKN